MISLHYFIDFSLNPLKKYNSVPFSIKYFDFSFLTKDTYSESFEIKVFSTHL